MYLSIPIFLNWSATVSYALELALLTMKFVYLHLLCSFVSQNFLFSY